MDKCCIVLTGQPMRRSVATRCDFELMHFTAIFFSSDFKYSLDKMGGKCGGGGYSE